MDSEGSFFLPIFPLLVVTRWAEFASVFILFGSALFWLCADGAFPHARAAADRLLRLSAVVAALSGLGWIAEIIANMAGGFGRLADSETLSLFFLQTQFGTVVAIRLILLAAALILAARGGRGRWRLFAFLLVGALLLIDQAWLGHAAQGGAGLRGAAMIVAYCLHILAGAAWVGGLPPLLFALREAHEAGDRKAAAAILLRFSLIALPAVALMAASGAGNAGFRVGSSIGRLFMSDYGLILCAKAVMVAAMLVLAAYNRLIALPRLQAALAPDDGQASKLRASVIGELALGLAVLAAAAALGVTPPPQ
jgi:putative copper resistance protein D